MSESPSAAILDDTWRDLARIVTAHVVMLRDAGVLDEAVLAALATALDGVGRGQPPAAAGLAELIAAFDERVDALTPAGATGAAAVGRGRAEVEAALLRLALRAGLLRVATALGEARRALLDLAAAHVGTIMPAYAGGQVAQPTTLAHFLGGAVAPLGRAGERLRAAYAAANRSPLGAGALASVGLEVDRARTAALLGFDGPVPSTFDAVAATDQVAGAAEAVGAATAAARRLLDEVLAWLRTEPTSFRLGEDWLGTDPALPGMRAPLGLERLAARARATEGEAGALARAAGDVGYGPVGIRTDGLLAGARALLAGAEATLEGTGALLAGGLEPNRAYLANRAGRGHTTSGDLADFLMEREELDPAAARAVTSLVVGRALADGVEASGITPERIDAAALLTVGRELGVEVEAVSRHLAPRRFLERRTAAGGPAQTATRAYLDEERLRLGADERWREEMAARLGAAEAELERLAGEAVAPG